MRRVSLALAALLVATVPVVSAQPPAAAATAADLAFIDTGIENASPLWYERGEDGAYLVHLLYDHERNAPNRAAGHIHFRLVGRAGARLTLEFVNLDNVWNGRPGSVAPELKTVATSADGERWTTVPTVALPGNRIRVVLTMPGDTLYVARMQPYRLSDLDRLVTTARGSTHAEVCNFDRQLMSGVLQLRVHQESCMLHGASCCQFTIDTGGQPATVIKTVKEMN